MSKYKISLNGKDIEVTLIEKSGASLKFEVAGNLYEVNVASTFPLGTDNSSLEISSSGPDKSISEKKELLAPMPGLVTKVLVKEKDEVSLNQPIMTIEAMKMENSIFSPIKGKIKKIHVKLGQEVKNQDILITFV